MPITIPTEDAPAADKPATPPDQPAEKRPVEMRSLHPADKLRQEAREGLRARLDGKASPTDKPKPVAAEPAKPATAEIDMDPATLKRVTDMSRELRQTREKLAALESVADKAKRWDEFESVKDDPAKVLELAKFDLKAYTEKLLNGEEPDDAETAALKREIAETKAKVDALEEKDKKTDEATATATAAEQRKTAETHISGILGKEPERWTYGYKSNFVSQAFDLSVAAVKALGRAVTDEEATKIVEKALDRVEADCRATDAAELEAKKLYTKPTNGNIPTSSTPANPPQSRPAPTIDSSIRAITPSAQPVKKHMTIAEAKEAAKAGFRARLTQRS